MLAGAETNGGHGALRTHAIPIGEVHGEPTGERCLQQRVWLRHSFADHNAQDRPGRDSVPDEVLEPLVAWEVVLSQSRAQEETYFGLA